MSDRSIWRDKDKGRFLDRVGHGRIENRSGQKSQSSTRGKQKTTSLRDNCAQNAQEYGERGVQSRATFRKKLRMFRPEPVHPGGHFVH